MRFGRRSESSKWSVAASRTFSRSSSQVSPSVKIECPSALAVYPPSSASRISKISSICVLCGLCAFARDILPSLSRDRHRHDPEGSDRYRRDAVHPDYRLIVEAIAEVAGDYGQDDPPDHRAAED